MIKGIINNSFLLLIGNSIGRLSVFVANILAARLMALDTYGQYAMIRSTISMIESLVSVSFGNIALKEISRVHSQDKNTSFNVMLAFILINIAASIFISLILFVFARQIVSNLFLSSAVMITGIHFGALLLLATLLSSAVQKIMIATENYSRIIFISTVNVLATIPVIYFLTAKYGLYGGLAGITVYFIFDFGVKFKFVISDFKVILKIINSKAIYKQLRNIARRSGALLVSGIISAFCYWYIRVIAINKQNNFSDIAIFDAAYQWLTIIMLITGATTSVGLQMMSKNKCIDSSKAFKVNLSINLFISIVLSVIFSLFSKHIMLLYGKAFISSHYLIYGICLVAILATVSSVLDKLLIVNNVSKVILVTKTTSAISGLIFMRYFFLSNIAMQMVVVYVISCFIEIVIYTTTICNNKYRFFQAT